MALRVLPSAAAAAQWLKARGASALRSDSRGVRAGEAFVAWPGHEVDARRYVADALAAGAAACLVEADGASAFAFDDERVAALPGLKAAAGLVADEWFDRPSAALAVIAITGTNGKTSTAWWTAQALTALGRRCGVIGTLGVGEPPWVGNSDTASLPPRQPIAFSGLTTPDPIRLHEALRRMATGGFSACAIEASSIGLVEQRLAGLRIAVAVFTNFTQDHLDYHLTMDAYWSAKARLFDWSGLRTAVVNVDDAKGDELARSLRTRESLDLWTCSTQRPARLQAEAVEYADDGGLAFEVREGNAAARVRTRLVGGYNAANLLAVIAAARALGVRLGDAARACRYLTPVPGRMQRIVGTGASERARHPEIVVDYAHTPDALEKALAALLPLARSRSGRLVCVFGCGGNRDAGKRPAMGAIAARLADRVVVTSDNPRGEEPLAIIDAIVRGIDRRDGVDVVEDRRQAIERAVVEAAPADIVLIAGKGHEDYQEVAGVRHPFSDAVEAERALLLRVRGEGSA